MIKRVLSVFALTLLVLAMTATTGCNTARGFEKDVRQGWQSLKRAVHQ